MIKHGDSYPGQLLPRPLGETQPRLTPGGPAALLPPPSSSQASRGPGWPLWRWSSHFPSPPTVWVHVQRPGWWTVGPGPFWEPPEAQRGQHCIWVAPARATVPNSRRRCPSLCLTQSGGCGLGAVCHCGSSLSHLPREASLALTLPTAPCWKLSYNQKHANGGQLVFPRTLLRAQLFQRISSRALRGPGRGRLDMAVSPSDQSCRQGAGGVGGGAEGQPSP